MNLTGNISSQRDLGNIEILSTTAMCLVNLIAFVGNLSNIIVILKTRQLRQTLTSFFVLNLCMVDLLAAVFVLPVSIATFIKGHWMLDSTLCSINGFINSLLTFASITNLCAISMERYYSIRLPMHHAAHLTLCRTLGVIVFTWVDSVIFAALPLLGLSSYEYRTHKKHCSFTWQDGSYSRVYVLVVGFWCFVLPGVILLLMYYGIFKIARLAATQVEPLVTDVSSNPLGSSLDTTRTSVSSNISVNIIPKVTPKPHRKQCKAIKTLIVILTAYIALWGPYFILHIHGALFGNVVQRETTEILTTWLGYVSFALNPFLYGWMNRSIREELKSLYRAVFCCKCSAEDSTVDEGPEGENFWQFLERTSAKNNSPISTIVSNRNDIKVDNIIENSELCF